MKKQRPFVGDDGYYHFVYVAFNEDNRPYIGKHSTQDLADGYLTSSNNPEWLKPGVKQLIPKFFYNSSEAALTAESKFLSMIPKNKRPMYGNLYFGKGSDFTEVALSAKYIYSGSTELGELFGIPKQTAQRWLKEISNQREAKKAEYERAAERATEEVKILNKIKEDAAGAELMELLRKASNAPIQSRSYYTKLFLELGEKFLGDNFSLYFNKK